MNYKDDSEMTKFLEELFIKNEKKHQKALIEYRRKAGLIPAKKVSKTNQSGVE